MRRLGITFADLYRYSLEDDILLEGLQYTHRSDVVLKLLTKEFGGLIYGNISLASAKVKPTKPKEYIEIFHEKDILSNVEFMNRMKFFGYHYVLTTKYTKDDLENHNIKTKRPFLYLSTFEGTYPTEIKRNSLPQVLFHVTHKSNVENIKKYGLLPKKSTTTFNHPSNRIYLFATTDPYKDIPKLIKSISNNTKKDPKDYVILKIVDYYPNHERFFLDPSMDIGYISDTCRGIFVHRGINPNYIR